MNGYMPRVGELFQWSGVTFRRIEGELVERVIRDGERAEVLFPVRYVKAPNNSDLVGRRGLMDIAEAPNFIFEGDDACNDPAGHPLTCDFPFGPVANESSD